MIPDDVLEAMRGRFDYYRLPGLRAATFEFNEVDKHLRIDFFFAGTSEDVDFDELDAGLLTELIADVWRGVDQVGFAVFFDPPSTQRALLDPARLHPRN